MPDGSLPDGSLLDSSTPDGAPIDDMTRDDDYTSGGGCSNDVEPAPRDRVRLLEKVHTLMSASVAEFGSELVFMTVDGEQTTQSFLPAEHWLPWVGTPFNALPHPFGMQLENEGIVVAFLGHAYRAQRVVEHEATTVDLGPLAVEVMPRSCWIPHAHRVGVSDCGVVPITHYDVSIDGMPVPEESTVVIDGYVVGHELVGVRGAALFLECADDWETNFVFDFIAVRD